MGPASHLPIGAPGAGGPPGRGAMIFRAEATQEAVREILAALQAGLAAQGVDPELAETAEIVLAEALNNICEHAYAERAPGPVRLWVKPGAEGLRISLCDAGHPMPGLALPSGDPPDLNVGLDALPEGGFGWFVIRSTAEDLAYARRMGCNRLSFRLSAG